MKKIIFLSGSAGTGKSSVLESMKNILPDSTYYQSSITRSYYKLKGVSSEIEMINSFTEDEKRKFHFEYLDYYIEYTKDKIINSNSTYCVIDRSPLDILAWTIYGCPSLTKDQFNRISFKISKFFTDIKQVNNKVFLYSFPLFSFGVYLPWLKDRIDNNSTDGFRYDPFGKNFLIDGILSNLQKLFTTQFILQTSYTDNIESRAKKIISFVNEY
jgi:energy-coupling factor transporter ATP-binding protein EcfA2